MAITNPADYNKKDGLPSIAAAVNRGANPTAQPSGRLPGVLEAGIGYAAPPIGAMMTGVEALQTSQQIGRAGGPAFTQDPLGNLSQTAETMVSRNPVTSGTARFFGFNPEDRTQVDPANKPMTLEDRYASNAAALADFNASLSGNAGIDALNKASGNIGRQDYQGAPQSAPPNMPQQRADIYGNITQATQQSLAQNAGNVGAPVPQSSITTTPSIAGSIAKAGQATTPTSPSGMSLPTSKPSMPSTSGLNLGDIPGIPSDIANMRFDLSGIANQIAQATGAGDPSVGSGISSEAMDDLASMADAEAQEADEASSPSGSVGAGGSTAGYSGDKGAKFNLGGMVGYQTNDALKDLMRGYF